MRRRTLATALMLLAFVGCVVGTEPESVNPVPVLGGTEPAVLTVSTVSVPVTVSGRDFAVEASVTWNEQHRATEFVTSTQLTVTLEAGDVATPGSGSLRVRNPAPGGGLSEAVSVPIGNPRPVVDSVFPRSVLAVVTPGTALRVFGSDFTSYGTGSAVVVQGIHVPTTYVSAGELLANVGEHLLQRGRMHDLRVENPAPGGGLSDPVGFEVENPVPVVTGVEPDSIPLKTAAAITLQGIGFVPGMTAWMDSVPYVPNSTSPASLTFSVPSTAPRRGGVSVWVSSPAPGGGTSNEVPVGVQELKPIIRGTVPAGLEEGSADQVLKVHGSEFAPDALVTVDGVPRATTWVHTDTLEIVLVSAEMDSVGFVDIGVLNPRGGGPSDAQTLSVLPAGRIAYSASGIRNIVTVRLDGTDRRDIVWTVTCCGSLDTWPAGESVLYDGYPDGIYLNAPGGTETAIDVSDARSPRINVTADWIYFYDYRGIWRIRPDGTQLESVVFNPQFVLHRWPSTDPVGNRIAYARYQDDLPADARDDLIVLDLDTQTTTSLGVLAHDSRWSPDGQWIAYRTILGELRLIRPDGTDDQRVFGPGALLAEDGFDWDGFDWSPDGRFIVAIVDEKPRVIELATGLELPLPIPSARFISWYANPG